MVLFRCKETGNYLGEYYPCDEISMEEEIYSQTGRYYSPEELRNALLSAKMEESPLSAGESRLIAWV